MLSEAFHPLQVSVYIENETLHSRLTRMLSSIKTCTHSSLDPDLPLGNAASDIIVAASSNSSSARQVVGNGRSGPHGDTRVLLIVEDPSKFERHDILNNSADGYIAFSDLSAESLKHALHQLQPSSTSLPMILGGNLVNHAFTGIRFASRTPLTAREMEALDLIVMGLSNKQIARRLNISPHGAKRLVGSVLMKLGAANRTKAAVIALQTGLITRAD